jgi:phage FluMu gp28-like protein
VSKEIRKPEFVNNGGRLPAALLLYQQRWIADQSPVKYGEKSRRVGLSWAEAADSGLTAAAADGMDTWYIGYNKDMAQEFIRDVAFWAKHYQLAAGEMEEEVIRDEDKDIITFRITFASGYRVTALSSRPSNLRGKKGRVIIDEAAFHDDLPGLKKAALALLMWGGRVIVISTHDGETNPFNEDIDDIRAGKIPYSLHRITLDDAIAEGLVERIRLSQGKGYNGDEDDAEFRAQMIAFYGDDADEELLCIPSKGKGLYLPRVIVEQNMRDDIPVIRWECSNEFATWSEQIRRSEALDFCREHLLPLLQDLDPNRAHYHGRDFGRSGDLSVDWPLAEREDLTYRPPFVLELRNVPFEEQKTIFWYILDRLPRLTGVRVDGRGNGQWLGEVTLQKYGPEIVEVVMISEKFYREEMPRLKSFMEDRTMEAPKNADVLDDFRSVKMEKGVPKIADAPKKGTDGKQRHGDSVVAACLAAMATRTQAVKFDYVSVERGYGSNAVVDGRKFHPEDHSHGSGGFGRMKGAW